MPRGWPKTTWAWAIDGGSGGRTGLSELVPLEGAHIGEPQRRDAGNHATR